MESGIKRKTSLTLDAGALDEAKRAQWLEKNADAFKAQSDWHAKNGHPLADIKTSPGGPRGHADPL